MIATYGCHNRPPITTFGAPTCQYTNSALGQADARCIGCKEREEPLPPIGPLQSAFRKVFAGIFGKDCTYGA